MDEDGAAVDVPWGFSDRTGDGVEQGYGEHGYAA